MDLSEREQWAWCSFSLEIEDRHGLVARTGSLRKGFVMAAEKEWLDFHSRCFDTFYDSMLFFAVLAVF
jgi:hypothetical protein